MDLEELLEKLDLDSPADLVYFEQFADLMESPIDIPFETLCALIESMDPSVLAELTSGYFEDILMFVPDGEDEVYTLLYNINTTFQTMIESGEEETLRLFAEELYRFRSWYLLEPSVLCINHSEGSEEEITLFEALTNYRSKNFTDNDYVFDFDNALSFQLDEYIVSLGSLINDGYEDDDPDEDNDGYAISDEEE
jgi:hypothetical protein